MNNINDEQNHYILSQAIQVNQNFVISINKKSINNSVLLALINMRCSKIIMVRVRQAQRNDWDT